MSYRRIQMALPQSKSAIQEESGAQDVEKPAEAASARVPSAQPADPRYPAAELSPARRLQNLLEAEMRGRRAPSVKRSLTMVLVLSLACSVAALSLYSLGWM
jgi:hypothetical protein